MQHHDAAVPHHAAHLAAAVASGQKRAARGVEMHGTYLWCDPMDLWSSGRHVCMYVCIYIYIYMCDNIIIVLSMLPSTVCIHVRTVQRTYNTQLMECLQLKGQRKT